MTSEVIYNGDLRTTATHLLSGNLIITDAPPDNQGKGEAFSPTDLVATALGSCMMTIMGIKARDNSIDITGAKAFVNKIMASNPRRIAKVEVTFTMPDRDYTEAEKAMLEEAALGCPVCKSLSSDCEAAIQFNWA
jgi:uncharacterized OsmC-like protein